MRIRLGNLLPLINLLALALLLAVTLLPEQTGLRTGLMLPFILFLPGYALVLALFPENDRLEGVARASLSCGLSFVISALLGLILHYTPWGIQAVSLATTQTVAIAALSLLAWRRQSGLFPEFRFRVEFDLGWGDSASASRRRVTSLLVIAIAVAGAFTINAAASPRAGEAFTDFYILGREGQIAGYPTDFILAEGQTVAVGYDGAPPEADRLARLTVGLINHQGKVATYIIKLAIGGEDVPLWLDGAPVASVGPVTLAPGQQCEWQLGFAPLKSGQSQRAEFILLMGGQPCFTSPPYLKINASLEAP